MTIWSCIQNTIDFNYSIIRQNYFIKLSISINDI